MGQAIGDLGSGDIFEYLLIFGSTLLSAWGGLRLGRWLFRKSLGLSYMFSAWGAVVVGMCVAWACNRWLRLTPAEREAFDLSPVAQEVWKYATQPKFGEQFLPLAMTGAFAFFCLVYVARRWTGTFWTGNVPAGTRRGWVGTWWGLGAWLLVWGLFSGLMYKLLASSIYMLPSESIGSRVGNVVVPAFALSLGWLGTWLRHRQCGSDQLTSGRESRATWMGSPGTPVSDSRVYFLAVLAVACSAAVLLVTSGTLVLATRGLMVAMIPLAWSLETWSLKAWITGQFWKSGWKESGQPLPVQAAESVGIWLPTSSGFLVVLGVYFNSIPASLAGLFALSLFLLPWLWPQENVAGRERWWKSLIAASPAVLAALISAFLLLREFR